MKLKVTADMAKRWLEQSEVNYRKLDSRLVAQYADAMRRGEWRYNGESIKLNGNGSVKDGQHRLHAIIESGHSIQTEVVEGVEDDCEIDTGKPRTLSDALRSAGYTDCNKLAALLRRSLGYYDFCRTGSEWSLDRKQSVTRCMNAIEKDFSSLTQTVLDAGRVAKHLPGMWTCSWIMYMTSRSESAASSEFWDSVRSGQNLEHGDPMLTLREFFIGEHAKPTHRRMGVRYRWAVTIKAWNAYVRADKLRMLKWTAAGRAREPFPLVMGCEMLQPEGQSCSDG